MSETIRVYVPLTTEEYDLVKRAYLCQISEDGVLPTVPVFCKGLLLEAAASRAEKNNNTEAD